MTNSQDTDDMPPITWALPVVMVMREIRSASELHRRLGDVMGDDAPSVEQVRRLVARPPERLTLRTLAGLCEVLDVEPGDLLMRNGIVRRDEAWTMSADPSTLREAYRVARRFDAEAAGQRQ